MEKKLISIPLTSTRELVRYVNEQQIQKEDIVTVLESRGQLFLIYYGRES